MTAKWGEITASEIASAIGGQQINGSPGKLVGGLSTDSRSMLSGHMFLALRGSIYDGHNFLPDAVNAGASGVIVESGANGCKRLSADNLAVITVPSTLKALGDLALWWRKKWAGKIIAVTGSNGKSTTKEMAASILSLNESTMKSPGNFNNLIGLPLTILSLNEYHKMAVLEMGMNRAGEIARLTRIADPDIGVITNVATAHLEGLGDLQGVIKAKGELLLEMSGQSTAILNGDDESTVQLIPRFQGPTVTFGLGKTNQVRAVDIEEHADYSQTLTIRMHDEKVTVKINLPGIHNVFNALAGAAVAFSLSIPKELIAKGLESFRPLKGRFRIIDLNGGIRVIDDTYNSNPSSLRAALQSIKDKEKANLIVGIGEMMELGKETAKYHFDVGRLVADAGAKYLVVLGEHGRQVIKGASEGGMDVNRTCPVSTHAEMVEAIKAKAMKDDVILLKGSRKMTLDKVAEEIKEYFGVKAGQDVL
jgi:UDP-N-acetylmuramoyl-tripeptide--D-alanyl-D-alanine ligase